MRRAGSAWESEDSRGIGGNCGDYRVSSALTRALRRAGRAAASPLGRARSSAARVTRALCEPSAKTRSARARRRPVRPKDAADVRSSRGSGARRAAVAPPVQRRRSRAPARASVRRAGSPRSCASRARATDARPRAADRSRLPALPPSGRSKCATYAARCAGARERAFGRRVGGDHSERLERVGNVAVRQLVVTVSALSRASRLKS